MKTYSVAQAVDADPLGVGGRRVLADGAEVEPRPRPADPVPGERDQEVADVDERPLVREEDLAEERDLRQDRDRHLRDQRDVRRARDALAEDACQPCPEERQCQPGDDLVGTQRDGHHRMDHAQQAAGQHRHEHAEPRVAGGDAGREPGDRPEQHHPLDPEVQDPGTLGEDLADRREEQDRAGRDARGQDVGEIHQAVTSRRSNRIR